VQGVGFRWFVREQARTLGLSGEVWNRLDGAVEVDVEGEPASVDQLVDLLRVGPDGAKVTDIEVLALESSGGILPNPFTVKR
jgi:acylphosphatase